jgi:P4 family phage/plasmid primase-like protien
VYLDHDGEVSTVEPTKEQLQDILQAFCEKTAILLAGQPGYDPANLRLACRRGYDPKKKGFKPSVRGWVTGLQVEYPQMPTLIKARCLDGFFDTNVYKPNEQLLALPYGRKGKVRVGREEHTDNRVLLPVIEEHPYADYLAQQVDPSWPVVSIPQAFPTSPPRALALAAAAYTESPPSSSSPGPSSCPPSPCTPVAAGPSCQPSELMQLLSMLKPARWDDRKDWVAIATVLKNEFGEDFRDQWIRHSANSSKFNLSDAVHTWESLAKANYSGKQLKIGTLHKMAKEDNPQAYQAFRAQRSPAGSTPPGVRQLLKLGDRGLAELCKLLAADKIKCGTGNVKDFYIFNEEACFWEKVQMDRVKNEVSRLLTRVLQDLNKEEEDDEEDGGLLSYVNKNYGLNHIMGLATAHFRDSQFLNKLDSIPHLLGVREGVIDLRTGAFRKCRPEDMIFIRCAVDYDPCVETASFHRLVVDAMAGDEALADYLQKLLGYGITGETCEEIIAIWTGQGRNMKGLLINLLKAVLSKDEKDGFMKPQHLALIAERPCANLEAEKAQLQGARIAQFNELKAGEKLKTSEVQLLTGGDPIPATKKFENPMVIEPRWLCIVSTNHMPEIDEVIPAIVERMIVIPFRVFFTDLAPGEQPTKFRRQRDNSLKTITEERKTQFLTWLVQGAVRWYREGGLKRDAPEVVKEYTRKYLQDQDRLSKFIEDFCDVRPGLMIPTRLFLTKYKEEMDETVTQKTLPPLMRRKGFEISCQRYAGGNPVQCYVGIDFKAPEPEAQTWAL